MSGYFMAVKSAIAKAIATLSASLAESTGAGQIGFKQSGTGAVSRTAQDKMRDFVSVKDFGAVGDGVANDTAAIQAAISALSTSGGTVFFPAGQYLFSSTLNVTSYGVTFRGAGDSALWNGASNLATAGSVLIKSASMYADAIVVTGGRYIIDNIALIGQAGNTGDGIYLKDSQSSVLMNICVAKMGGSGIRIGTKSGAVGNVNDWKLINVSSQKNSDHGVLIYDQSTTVAAQGPNANAGTAIGLNVAFNSGEGLRVENGQFNTFTGCLSQQNSGYGVALIGTALISLYATFVGGDVESNTTGNWYVSGNAKHVAFIGASPNYPALDPDNFNVAFTSGTSAIRGIKFHGNSSVLQEYQTGTWTPQLVGNDIDPTSVTYNQAVYGTYTRIGNVVHVQGYMRTDAVTKGSMATYVAIGGLPFVASTSASLAVSEVDSWVTNHPCAARISAGTNRIFLFYRTSANGNESILPVSAVATGENSNVIRFGGIYMTA